MVRAACADLGRQRLANEQGERVAVEGHAPRLLGDVNFGFAPQRFRAVQLDFAGHAMVEAQFGQIIGFALAVARAVGQLQQIAIGEQCEPGIGDLGDQQQLRGRAIFLDGEVVLERGITQAADPAEQIELELRRREPGGIRAREVALAAQCQRAGRALTVGRTASFDGWHEIGALDAVLRARRLHVERGNAQVAIVHQCPRNQVLQLRIREEFLPAYF